MYLNFYLLFFIFIYSKFIFFFTRFPYWADFPVGAILIYRFMLFHLGFSLACNNNDHNNTIVGQEN